jgi:hypothetical protein
MSAMRGTKIQSKSESNWALRPLSDELGEALRAELRNWPGMRMRPMMGTLSFFRGRKFLGCYVNRELLKSKPDWVNRPGEPTYVCIRLRAEDAARALERPEIRQSRLEFAGWIEISLASHKLFEEAVRWFGRAYEHPAPSKESAARKRELRRARASYKR